MKMSLSSRLCCSDKELFLDPCFYSRRGPVYTGVSVEGGQKSMVPVRFRTTDHTWGKSALPPRPQSPAVGSGSSLPLGHTDFEVSLDRTTNGCGKAGTPYEGDSPPTRGKACLP